MKSVLLVITLSVILLSVLPNAHGYGNCGPGDSDSGSNTNIFYLAALKNLGTQTMWLRIITPSSSPVSYTVEQYTGVITTGTVTSTSPAKVNLPSSYFISDSSYSNRKRGIYVHSDSVKPISVVLVNYRSTTIGDYLAYPYQEYPINQYQYYAVSTGTLAGDASSVAALVGNVDNTTITIIPTQSITVPQDIQNPASPNVGVNAGSSFTIFLHRMQTFLIEASDDISGTSIVSDKPLTVVSGHECGNVPDNVAYCEHISEQIPPTVTWGKQFLLTPYAGRPRQYYKIIAAESETTIKYKCNGVGASTISLSNAGDVSFQSSNSGIYCSLVSNKPIMVTILGPGQDIGGDGDPVISMISPIEQYLESATFMTFNTFSGIISHYINIASTTKDTVLMDGQSISLTWNNIYDSDNNIMGYGTQIPITDLTSHTITTQSGIKFGTLVYGFGSYRGYSYSAGVNNIQLVKNFLQIQPWYGNILGGEPLLVSGPTFTNTDKIALSFDSTTVNCTYVSAKNALCVSPSLTKTGKITVKLYHNNSLYEKTTTFYSKRIKDDDHVSINSNKLLIYAEENITLTWSKTSLTKPLQDVIAPSDILVDIKLHIFQISNGVPTQEQVTTLSSNISNTGSTTVTVPTISHYSNQVVYTAVICIEAKGSDSLNPTLFDKVQGKVTQWTDIIWIVSTNKQSSGTKLWSACKAWSISEPSSIGQQLLTKVRSGFPCPPTIGQARIPNSGLIEDTNTKLIELIHPNAAKCFNQRTITSDNDGSSNKCCYGNNGNLIVGPTSGGSVDKVSLLGSTELTYLSNLISHQFEDVLPFIFCCKGTPSSCDTYYQRRPSDDGSAFSPPVPACVYGDPHIVTLDLHKYTFNGKGEFVLVETNDQSLTLQGRMIEATDENGDDAPGTVFSALAAKQNDSDTIQFEINNDGNVSLIALVNGEIVTFEDSSSQEFENVIITDSGNNTLGATFSKGAVLQAQERNGFISVLIVSLPANYRNKTQGLMGSYNGDETDDLTPRGNGTKLPLNSTLQKIHEEFGITWIIDNPSDSLFTYKCEESWSTYYFPSFTPVYEPSFSDPALEEKANQICGDDDFCKFDIATTGRVEIGETTYQGGQEFNELVNLSKPIICNPSCVNGACVDTNVCACGEGYEGDTCDTIIYSTCDQSPCNNNGTCQYHAGNYMCVCLPGFAGEFCNNTYPIYCSQPCVHGYCYDINTCACDVGYTGVTCETIVYSDCDPNPCNNSTCQYHAGSHEYICTCQVGYTGKFCDQIISMCNPNPCKNDGICQDHDGDYICTCPPCSSGKNCEVNLVTPAAAASCECNTILIVGIVLAVELVLVVIVIAVIMFVCCCCLKKKTTKTKTTYDIKDDVEMDNIFENMTTEELEMFQKYHEGKDTDAIIPGAVKVNVRRFEERY